MARCVVHTTHRIGFRTTVEQNGHPPQCNNHSLDIFRRGSRMVFPLYRHPAQHFRHTNAHDCQLLRQHRRTNGTTLRKENTHRTHARWLLGRCVVLRDLSRNSHTPMEPTNARNRCNVGHIRTDTCSLRRRVVSLTTKFFG